MLGLGHPSQDYSGPRLFPPAGSLSELLGVWIDQGSLFSNSSSDPGRVSGNNLFSKSVPIYECRWSQTHWLFTHWEETAIPKTALGSKEASDPEASLWLQTCKSHGHLCHGPPIPIRQPDLQHFSALLLCLRIWVPISGFPPTVGAFIKQIGSNTIDRLGSTVRILNTYWL